MGEGNGEFKVPQDRLPLYLEVVRRLFTEKGRDGFMEYFGMKEGMTSREMAGAVCKRFGIKCEEELQPPIKRNRTESDSESHSTGGAENVDLNDDACSERRKTTFLRAKVRKADGDSSVSEVLKADGESSGSGEYDGGKGAAEEKEDKVEENDGGEGAEEKEDK